MICNKIHWTVFVLVLAPLTPQLFGAQDASAADDPDELIHLAEARYRAGQFAESADAYEVAIKAGAISARVLYDAACSSMRAGRVESALHLLRTSVKAGYRDVSRLRADSNLALLHGEASWSEVVAICTENQDAYLKTLGNPDLHLELMAMMRADQEVRTQDHVRSAQGEPHATGHEHADGSAHTEEHAPPDEEPRGGQGHAQEGNQVHGAGMRDVDAVHTARMKEIIAKHGWPTRSMVGREGATAAWLLVQHADADPRFQRQCLELMLEADQSEYSLGDLAYLTDRVLVNEGKHQLFGTQFHLVDGEMAPRPIKDPERLDARRKAAGLSTMKEYLDHMTGDHDH